MKKIIILFVLVTTGFASSPAEENESFAQLKTVLDPLVPKWKSEGKHDQRMVDQARARSHLAAIEREMQLMDALWTAAKSGLAKNGKATKNTETCKEGCIAVFKEIPAMVDQLHKEVTPLASEKDRAGIDEAFAKFKSVIAHSLEAIEAGKFP